MAFWSWEIVKAKYKKPFLNNCRKDLKKIKICTAGKTFFTITVEKTYKTNNISPIGENFGQNEPKLHL